jgi:O-antigen ligase
VGLLDRALSIGTATSGDISLLNRFLETRAAWELIKVNPVVGYGMGTEFGFFDAISGSTWVKSYVHNGFVMLWYKFGIIGLVAVLTVWGASIAAALRAARMVHRDDSLRVLSLVAGVCLIAIIPSHLSAATFTTGDTTMTFALLCGLANGLYARARGTRDAAPAAVPSEAD